MNALFHRPWLESFLFAIALAVGLTPELLPMVVSVTLARGAIRLARKHVIVKQLPVIQNLGTMDVFCTDKDRHAHRRQGSGSTGPWTWRAKPSDGQPLCCR